MAPASDRKDVSLRRFAPRVLRRHESVDDAFERFYRKHVAEVYQYALAVLGNSADAEATVETVADGMAAHPTLSEAIKEAGLVALGRAIHLPNRKRALAGS